MAFRENAQKEPVHMLNLVRFSKIATYPDERSVTGVEAYAPYKKMQLSLS